MCTGTAIGACLISEGTVTAWRIHQVAYVENLYPRRQSNSIHPFHQTDIAFLNQIEKLQAVVVELFPRWK